MSRKILALAGAALSALLGAPARADDIVTITARTPEKETASSVTVITADDIARTQAPSVFEALRTVPGVTAVQTGGPGSVGTIALRGAKSGQTLTLIDGVPVNDTTSTSGYNYAYLDSGIVERIEVLRGAGSAIWGSDAIGGVINIITVQPGKSGVSAYAEGGSLDTGRLGVRGAYTFGPLTLSGYGTAYKTGGISTADERDGNPERDGDQATTLGARGLLALGGGVSVYAGARMTKGDSDSDDGFSFATGVADSPAIYRSRESLVDGGASWRSADDRFGVNGSISKSLTKTFSNGDFGPFSVRAQRVQERLTADAKIADNQTILVGAEHNDLDAVTTFQAAASSSMNAGFATYQGKFLDRLLVEGGLRYETDSRFGDILTGRAGVALDVWQGGVLRAAGGTGYRAPTIAEVNGSPPFTGPNFNLKPEKSNEWEIGVEQNLLSEAVKLRAVYFDRDTSDLIVAPFGSPSFINLPKAESKGVELTADAKLGPFDLSANYTYDRARDLSTGRQLDHVAKHQGSIDATWHATNALALGARAIWNGAENDRNFGFPGGPVTLASWTRLDLRASYEVSDHAEIYGRIDNANDERYQDVFGYGTLGRTAYFGIRVKS